MKKEFIAPSFEVKMFNRACIMTDSAVVDPTPTPEPGSNLKNAETSLQNIKSVTISI